MVTMDKRYQFFISSTFTDLKEERQSVLRAVLELDHIPAGMELFPASDETSWQLIKDVIDASDYHLLLVGGRYGSTDEAGLSYTEREYDYAVQCRKPVLAFLHENPDALPRQSTDTDKAAWEKLLEFRERLKKTHAVVMWQSSEHLKAKVIVSIISAIKRHPAIGWVRADQVPSGGTLAEMLALKNHVADLEKELKEESLVPPPGTERFEQGDDPVVISGEFRIGHGEFDVLGPRMHPTAVALTWNEIFAGVAPTMISEASQEALYSAFRRLFEEKSRRGITIAEGDVIRGFDCQDGQIETCIVQFRALGLIRESVKKRSVKDTSTYWKLTRWGDHLMTTLRAIRKATK